MRDVFSMDTGAVRAAPGATVLAVDDAPENLALLARLLKGRYQVRVANSGERALKLAATGRAPDLILLDILMPGMDGWEVCQRLKADPALRHVPVVFLSARSAAADRARGLALGAADCLGKPIDPAQLLACLQTHLQPPEGAQ